MKIFRTLNTHPINRLDSKEKKRRRGLQNNMNNQEKSIVFIGFMGVGKTTIGKLVAEKLHWDFIDIDEKIEKEFHMPTTKIFEQYGERTFREREKQIITNLSKEPLHIISVGGGAFMQEEIRQACLDNCIVIYLDLSWNYWKDRMQLIIDTRPVLQNKSMKDIEALFNSRKDAYSYHHLKVNTDHLTAEEVAQNIVESLK